MAEGIKEGETLTALLKEQNDPLNTVYLASLMGLTKGLWKVSGQGSGGVTRAFGEDLWKLVKVGSEMLGEEKDLSTTTNAMEFYDRYLVGRFNIAENIEYNVTDDKLEMTVTDCKTHFYTDYLAENDVPRHIGCPLAQVGAALMEEVTGESFIIDNIEHNKGECKIVLNSL
ncbi:hypothetical protein [Methanobacterium ferruginis]|jgi:hypothetical protein|uniref:hypothetical protein n=1 Tax=Methanobacterium ferruginis TaxID=710191 RepID=UPI0025732395|nr:hypothetical protein [Methanobacterium ferruginis]MCC7550301.1 hypothetical protein [Methanobacterium sp.]BDZ68717.1 hypothetical protein GCM10025860_21650 [Methanobacterium ferruginis]